MKNKYLLLVAAVMFAVFGCGGLKNTKTTVVETPVIDKSELPPHSRIQKLYEDDAGAVSAIFGGTYRHIWKSILNLDDRDITILTIWLITHHSGNVLDRNMNFLYETGWGEVELIAEVDFIQQLPTAVRQILALYTTFLSKEYLRDASFNRQMSKALGNFSTIRRAQRNLLKTWKGAEVPKFDSSDGLWLMQTNDALYVILNGLFADEFRISADGQIFFISRISRLYR